jgi:uncharacterized membrane protein
VLILGALYAFLNPPFAVSDESEYAARLSQLSALTLSTHADAGGPFHQVDPELARLSALYEPLSADPDARISPLTLVHDLTLQGGSRVPTRFAGRSASLSSLSELPLLPAWWLGGLLGLPVLGQLYLARLTSVLCFALLGGYAFMSAGRLGWALFALATMPMTLSQSAGVSGEGLTTGLAFCFFALVCKGALEDSAASSSTRERLTLLGLLIALVLCHPVFLACAPCFFALRREALPASLQGARFVALAFGLGALALSIWSAVDGPLFDIGELSSPGAQWEFLSAHPGTVLFRVLRSMLKQLDEYAIELTAFRDPLSSQTRFAGGVIAAVCLELILLLSWGVFAREKDTHGARTESAASVHRQRFWFFTSFVAYGGALVLVAYLTQNKPGSLYLHGFAPRALIPLTPALLCVLSTRGRPTIARFLSQRPHARIVLPVILINALCFLSLLGRYFVPADIDWPY